VLKCDVEQSQEVFYRRRWRIADLGDDPTNFEQEPRLPVAHQRQVGSRNLGSVDRDGQFMVLVLKLRPPLVQRGGRRMRAVAHTFWPFAHFHRHRPRRAHPAKVRHGERNRPVQKTSKRVQASGPSVHQRWCRVRKPGPIHSGGGCVAPVLRYLLLPGWEWLVGAPGQLVAQLLEQSLHAMRLDGLERDPIYSRS